MIILRSMIDQSFVHTLSEKIAVQKELRRLLKQLWDLKVSHKMVKIQYFRCKNAILRTGKFGPLIMKNGKNRWNVVLFLLFCSFPEKIRQFRHISCYFFIYQWRLKRSISQAPDPGSISELPLTFMFLLSFVKNFLATVFGQQGSEILDTVSNPTVFMHNSLIFHLILD